jgi:hypothetical protein
MQPNNGGSETNVSFGIDAAVSCDNNESSMRAGGVILEVQTLVKNIS